MVAVAGEDGVRPASRAEVRPQDLRAIVNGEINESELELVEELPSSSVQFLEPLGWYPRNIFCIGTNYREHASEFSASGYDSSSAGATNAVPTLPIVFTKPPSSVIGPGDTIERHDGLTSEVDYEAELAVVIGRGGRGISKDEALSHVFGFTIVNDVTARDLQRDHRQWFLGKGLDSFCPVGPTVVTADEFKFSEAIVKCTVNGELRQEAPVTDLIFDVSTLIHTISAGIALVPGDVIATGTPAGVGIGFDPPKFLQSGDEVSVVIDQIGRLTNRIG